MKQDSDVRPGTGARRGESGEWRALFAGAAAGQVEALQRIYELAADRLFGLAAWRTGSREEAADVVQDVFVRLAERRQALRRVEDPLAWLLTIAHRIAVDTTRRRARREASSIDDNPFLQAPAADPSRRLDARLAAAALRRLPPAQRATIYLHHHADCTFAEIGRITGVSTFTAASRYRLGIGKLRRMLEEEDR